MYWTYVIILYCRIDDIQDNSILRRGIPVAHSVYGVARTINAASYLLLKVLKKVQSLNHPDAMTVTTEHLLNFCYSQGLDIGWRDNYTCPSLEEYKQMIKKSKDRTEPWVGFTWSCELANFIAGHSMCTFECSHVQCCDHSLFSEIKIDSLIIIYHCKSSEQMQYVE